MQERQTRHRRRTWGRSVPASRRNRGAAPPPTPVRRQRDTDDGCNRDGFAARGRPPVLAHTGERNAFSLLVLGAKSFTEIERKIIKWRLTISLRMNYDLRGRKAFACAIMCLYLEHGGVSWAPTCLSLRKAVTGAFAIL